MSVYTRRRNELPATVVLIDHIWHVSFEVDGEARTLLVDEAEAWNFDIEQFLLVWIDAHQALHEGVCRILRRKGNKKFVRIS